MTGRVADGVQAETGLQVPYMVGTMIEVPRAALIADKIAEHAEFFSFGTNDLTQMTFGYSRDDIGKFLPFYLEKKLLPARSVRGARPGGGRRADPDRHRARPADAAGPQGRHLRRARRRAVVGGVLPPGRHELRVVLAVLGSDRLAGRGPGPDQGAAHGRQWARRHRNKGGDSDGEALRRADLARVLEAGRGRPHLRAARRRGPADLRRAVRLRGHCATSWSARRPRPATRPTATRARPARSASASSPPARPRTNLVTALQDAHDGLDPDRRLHRAGADAPDRQRRLPGSRQRRHHPLGHQAQLPGQGRQGPGRDHQGGVPHRRRPAGPGRCTSTCRRTSWSRSGRSTTRRRS